MTIGPVEYLIVEFPGNEFDGKIIPAIIKLVDDGTIRLIDLMFITKDDDGNIAEVEFDECGGLSAFAELKGDVPGFINADDVEHTAEGLEVNSSAALLVWEDTWATTLRDAILNAGGEVLDLERVPYEVVNAAVEFSNANK